MKRWLLCVLLVGTLFAATSTQTLSFQGKLLDNTGAAVTATKAMTFTLYPQATGGTAVPNAIWSQSVAVQNGIYSVELDASAVDLTGVNDAWIEVAVAGETLSPRLHMSSSAFAKRAAQADLAITANSVVGSVVSVNSVNANSFYLGNAPIIESGGTNLTTGYWVKYADGTLIEWGDSLIPYTGQQSNLYGTSSGATAYGISTVAYPYQSYVTTPSVFSNPSTGGPMTTRAISVTRTAFTVTWSDVSTSVGAHGANWLSIGRWK